MITKGHLLAMICDLAAEIDTLRVDMDELEREVHRPRPPKKGTNIDGVRRGRGRPRGSKSKR